MNEDLASDKHLPDVHEGLVLLRLRRGFLHLGLELQHRTDVAVKITCYEHLGTSIPGTRGRGEPTGLLSAHCDTNNNDK